MDKVKLKKLEDVMTFGKYKGKKIEDVLSENPSYLVWAHDDIKWFKLEQEIYDEAVDQANNKRWDNEELDNGIDIYDFMAD